MNTLQILFHDRPSTDSLTGLKLVPQGLIIPRIIKNLATVSYQDTQTYLWHEPSDGTSPPPDNSLFWYYNNGYEGVYEGEYGSYFVSAVPNGTLTGVLREHAMRLNSSVSCNTILPDAYPSTCGGSLPFDTSFSREGQFDMEVCVPGDQGTSLWTLSRDRQDISEDMFIKVRIPPESDLMYQGADWVENFTVKCTANTTRGYFELGNVRNNLSTGLLLEQWPDKNDLRENFNVSMRIAPRKPDAYNDLHVGLFKRQHWNSSRCSQYSKHIPDRRRFRRKHPHAAENIRATCPWTPDVVRISTLWRRINVLHGSQIHQSDLSSHHETGVSSRQHPIPQPRLSRI